MKSHTKCKKNLQNHRELLATRFLNALQLCQFHDEKIMASAPLTNNILDTKTILRRVVLCHMKIRMQHFYKHCTCEYIFKENYNYKETPSNDGKYFYETLKP